MSNIVIIGCGVVGAMIAYQLSLIPELFITVIDKNLPAQGSTSASLGVLMGALAHKARGKSWKMRCHSLQRYATLIPELEAVTNRHIPFNKQGILMLCLPGEDMSYWQRLVKIRKYQGYILEIWDKDQLKSKCPYIDTEKFIGAVYSPEDRQVDPVSLTLALVEAAKSNGVTFHFNSTVASYELENQDSCKQIEIINVEDISKSTIIKDVDWLIIAAGLGSLSSLERIENWAKPSDEINQMLDIRPVLGQAVHLQLNHTLNNSDFYPVITCKDLHIVPLKDYQNLDNDPLPSYWVGATLEFPDPTGNVFANPDFFAEMIKNAIAFFPMLAEASIIKTWSGLRPRPESRPAPVVGYLPGYNHVLVATGHYRNGVLFAPDTAQIIQQKILGNWE